MANELSPEILNEDLDSPTLRKRLNKYRSELHPEYDQRGKLKPMQKWIGVTPQAKRMAKRLMRHANATAPVAELENFDMTAQEVHASKRERSAKIRELNSEIRARIRELELGTTNEQIAARKKTDEDRKEAKKPAYTQIGQYTPEEGGLFTPFLKTHKVPGYIGIELRALRRVSSETSIK
jgi:hypothetical protein